MNDYDELRLCSNCHQYECVAPAKKCWRCREQDMLDSEPWLDEKEPEYPCARCGIGTSQQDDIGNPLCSGCYAELTMTEDEENGTD